MCELRLFAVPLHVDLLGTNDGPLEVAMGIVLQVCPCKAAAYARLRWILELSVVVAVRQIPHEVVIKWLNLVVLACHL